MLATRLIHSVLLLLLCSVVLLAAEQETAVSTLSPDSASDDANTVFTIQPEPVSYTTTKRSAELVCEAKEAFDIYIKCNSQYVSEDVITKSGSTVNGQRIYKVQMEITKDMVFIFFARYSCFCIAILDNGERQVNSREGEFRIARLSKVFPQSPIEVSQHTTEDAEMICRRPDGSPSATISWEKDGNHIDDSQSKYLITSEGNLIIRAVTMQDQANYTCIASNGFYTRTTQPAKLYVYTNGGWSSWGPWDACDTTCGNGLQSRWRMCNSPAPSGRDGQACQGASRQTGPCTVQCSPVDGQWSSWGPWEACDPVTCQHVKRRRCDSPAPSGSGRTCAGSDFTAANCTDTSVCNVIVQGPVQITDSENIILWIVLIAAVAVFAVILVVTVMCLMRKKSRRGRSYEEESHDTENGSRDGEKFDRARDGPTPQPDLTKAIPLRQQRTYNSRSESLGTPSEKHPMINTNSRPLPPQREYYMQISPNTNCDHHDYMQIGSGRDSDNESRDEKLSHHSSSPESGICNSCDRQSLISGQIPASIDVEALAWGNVSHTGGRLSVGDSGISITVPEGAIGRNQSEEIFIAALREDKERPILLEKQTLLSPVVLCGPQDTTFNKSLILSFDHCASLKLGQWKLSIYSSNSPYNVPAQWEKLVTLNQEILHMPVFCQLDSTKCHVMVDQLASRYCLVGESMYGSKAVKQLKLAVFAQPFSVVSLDSSIRVYVLPDTQEALCSVIQQESKLGAKLIDKPKQIAFQDGGHNLCLMIDTISNGWASKLPSQYQEIPFRHIWNSPSNLHCSFAFERLANHPSSQLSCKIQVYQKSVLSNRQQININGGNLESAGKMIGHQKDLSSTVTVNTQSSSGCSSVVMLDNREQIFRLPSPIKKKLASHLDLPCHRGNDWRMLASALSSDRQINFFASKPSPTEAILDLWEARTTVEESPVSELANILRAMGRQDAAVILDRDLPGNAWV